LRDANGGFLQEPPLTSTTLNVLDWSIANAIGAQICIEQEREIV